jgi:hypothetical protein
MENDPNTIGDLLRDSAFRRTPAVRPETELTFLHDATFVPGTN